MPDLNAVTALKALLLTKLVTALETLEPDAKGFSAVATAALAAVKAFHDELETDTTAQTTHLNGVLARYTQGRPQPKAN